MEKKRENNFDLLRIICAIAVIIIHVSSIYIDAITNKEIFGRVYTRHIFTTCTYNVLSRFSVPCFVMLSGAFLLSDDRNQNYKYFYKKSIKSIGIITIIFSIFYFLYAILRKALGILLRGREGMELLEPIKNLIIGKPFYHMWYLYMLIGLYLLTPIIIKFKNDISNKTFEKVSIVFLIVASLSYWTSSYKVYWDIGLSFEYLGYLMIGYVIRNKYNIKSNSEAIKYIILGILVELLLVYIRYIQITNGIIVSSNFTYNLIDALSPLMVISSVLIFKGFAFMNIKRDFSKLSLMTFLIYLIHAGVCDIFSEILR